MTCNEKMQYAIRSRYDRGLILTDYFHIDLTD